MSHQPTDLWREVKRVCERHALKPDREFVYDHMSRELDDAISAAHAAATARIAELEAERQEWERRARVTLWLNHGCPSGRLYGDDGELQCPHVDNHPGLWDFKRTPWGEIERILFIERIRKLALSSTAGGQ